MIVERLGQHVVTQAADLVMQVDVRWGLARSSGNKDNHNHNTALATILLLECIPAVQVVIPTEVPNRQHPTMELMDRGTVASTTSLGEIVEVPVHSFNKTTRGNTEM
eukprot:CAMPEP_0206468138 /NCGR_PEP_ID=MMETSP0324_2-20121206/29439_1 /ASSEMBLY_ACC=CAM_ASM_000836 /TAXON_ID=2866 /ORGANISM="Crypthecodinium cohnii, Strain Seligo" /LENGTH=106 /DNA_ID=CAMNT_0053941515 /DNA_START=121 /DNA_END=439 /DNA_ORIENTATION=-